LTKFGIGRCTLKIMLINFGPYRSNVTLILRQHQIKPYKNFSYYTEMGYITKYRIVLSSLKFYLKYFFYLVYV